MLERGGGLNKEQPRMLERGGELNKEQPHDASGDWYKINQSSRETSITELIAVPV